MKKRAYNPNESDSSDYGNSNQGKYKNAKFSRRNSPRKSVHFQFNSLSKESLKRGNNDLKITMKNTVVGQQNMDESKDQAQKQKMQLKSLFAATFKKFNPVNLVDKYNFLSRFFFRQFSSIFKIKKGAEFTSKNLIPLPAKMSSTQALLRFKKEQKRLRKLHRNKKIYLRETIWSLIREDMKWAVIFKFLE